MTLKLSQGTGKIVEIFGFLLKEPHKREYTCGFSSCMNFTYNTERSITLLRPWKEIRGTCFCSNRERGMRCVWKERWGGGSLCDIFKTSCIIICTWAAYAFKITVYFWNISAPLLPFHMNHTWAIIAGALAELWPLALMIIDALKHKNKPKLNQNRIRALNFDK